MVDRKTKRIFMSLLRGDLSYEASRKALADPEGHSLSKKMANGRTTYRYWGKIKTARTVVAYCWSCHRNEAGYFLGWREIYSKDGKSVRDGYIARRCKKRLSLLQKRRTDALLSKGAVRI